MVLLNPRPQARRRALGPAGERGGADGLPFGAQGQW